MHSAHGTIFIAHEQRPPTGGVRERNKLQKKKAERATKVTFSNSDLATLGKLVSAGQILMPTEHSVITKLKGAMSRMGLPVPKGL